MNGVPVECEKVICSINKHIKENVTSEKVNLNLMMESERHRVRAGEISGTGASALFIYEEKKPMQDYKKMKTVYYYNCREPS